MRQVIGTIICMLLLQVAHAQLHTDMALKYLVKTPAAINNKTILIILLHGYGSNEADLFSLAAQLPANAVVMAPRGTITLRPNSYCWYTIDRPNAACTHWDEEENSKQLILQLAEQASKKYNIPLSRIYLAGFSQGAIMGMNIALTQPEKIKGIMVLSGRVLDETKPHVVSASLINKVAIFIAHGTEDKVLPIQCGRDEKAFLDSRNIKNEYHEYHIVHTIVQDEINDINKWLEKQVK